MEELIETFEEEIQKMFKHFGLQVYIERTYPKDGEVGFKVVGHKGEFISPFEIFQQYVGKRKELDINIYGKRFHHNNHEVDEVFVVNAFFSKKRKYPIQAIGIKTGMIYRFTTKYVNKAIKLYERSSKQADRE